MPIEAFALERRLINDLRNLMALCVHCHLDSRRGLDARVPYEAIPEAAWQFAREIDMERALEQRYAPAVPRDVA